MAGARTVPTRGRGLRQTSGIVRPRVRYLELAAAAAAQRGGLGRAQKPTSATPCPPPPYYTSSR